MDKLGLCKHLLMVYLSFHVAAHFNHMYTPLYIGQSWVLPKSSPRSYSCPLHTYPQTSSGQISTSPLVLWHVLGHVWNGVISRSCSRE